MFKLWVKNFGENEGCWVKNDEELNNAPDEADAGLFTLPEVHHVIAQVYSCCLRNEVRIIPQEA